MKLYSWEELNEFVNACTRCGLCRSRVRPVMGRGSLQADTMIVAEAPGGQEDRAGVPFVGPAGKMLDDLLASCGMRRNHYYLTAVYHPSALLRDPAKIEETRRDFLRIAEKRKELAAE